MSEETTKEMERYASTNHDRLQFALYEYWQLRTEIRERLQSMRHIVLGCYAAVGGALATGTALLAAGKVALDVLSLAFLVPFLAIIPAYSFFIAEELSTAVLARYIRLNIELPFFREAIKRRKNGETATHLPFGWETYAFIMRDANLKLKSDDSTQVEGIGRRLRKALDRTLIRPAQLLLWHARRFIVGEEREQGKSVLEPESVRLSTATMEDKATEARGDIASRIAETILKLSIQDKDAIRVASRRDRHQNRAASRFFRLAALACLIASGASGIFYWIGEVPTPPPPEYWPAAWACLWLAGIALCVVQTVKLHGDMVECSDTKRYIDVDSLPVPLCESYLEFFER